MAHGPPLPWGHFPLALGLAQSFGVTDAVWMSRQQREGWLLVYRPPLFPLEEAYISPLVARGLFTVLTGSAASPP